MRVLEREGGGEIDRWEDGCERRGGGGDRQRERERETDRESEISILIFIRVRKREREERVLERMKECERENH